MHSTDRTNFEVRMLGQTLSDFKEVSTVKSFGYNPSGQMNKFSIEKYFGEGNCTPSLMGAETWRYCYSPSGEREQTRLFSNAEGDKNDNFYDWRYYLLDGSKQMAVWEGIQISDLMINAKNLDNIPIIIPNPLLDATLLPSNEMSSERVFLQPTEYNTYFAGTSVSWRVKNVANMSDWEAHCKVNDHLGSTRVGYKINGGVPEITALYDYEPFGKPRPLALAGGATEEERLAYIGKEKDQESDLGDHGVRKYDYETGCFTSTDVLWEKYAGWSPYHYCGNNPVNMVDWNGKDVIVAFSGVNLPWEKEDKATAGVLIENIKNYVKENSIKDVNALAIATTNGGNLEEAINFINKNYSAGEKIILYGYSLGAVAAHVLSNDLKEKGKKVDLLITVDEAYGPLSWAIDRTIPCNVLFNFNYYQTKLSTIGSYGGKNKADDYTKTKVQNNLINTNHDKIDEETLYQVQQKIFNEIGK